MAGLRRTRKNRREVRRIRRRTLVRWTSPFLAVLVLFWAFVSVVRRDDHGRQLTERLRTLDGRLEVLADQITAERLRSDSLTTRSRIEGAASILGMERALGANLIQVNAAVLESISAAEGGVDGTGGER